MSVFSTELIKSFESIVPLVESGEVSYSSPSNIALVKYWGKREIQIPCNPSISFSLNKAYTETKIIFKKKEINDKQDVSFFFMGERKDSFLPKINNFLKLATPFIPIIKEFHLEIHSKNTFPHSAGIASSASSMSALAGCFVHMAQKIGDFDHLPTQEVSKFISFLSRLGSGSACRSIYSGFSLWGFDKNIRYSSDEFAVKLKDVSPAFNHLHDYIFLVDSGEKEVSSTLGHALMNDHTYATKRFESARDNCSKMISCLKTGDIEIFGKIIEKEAFELHSMMMLSPTPYLLMRPNSITIINMLHSFRKETAANIFFTLDAGPNVHVIAPDSELENLEKFTELVKAKLSSDVKVFKDAMGNGSSLISHRM